VKTFAGVVTHEPDLARLAENVAAIAVQVDQVVLFDNGSKRVADIEELVNRLTNLVLLRSAENRGVAHALNELASYALEHGATHLVTLDQDSVSSTDMVHELARTAGDDIPLVTPYIVDRNKSTVEAYQRLQLPEVEIFQQAARRGAITSGALMKLAVWREVGGFDDELFIDYVDYDFNQRLLIAGYPILRANRTHLLHEVGRASPTWLWVPRKDLSGRWRLERFYAFGHSAQRCYYKARNRILFTRKYGNRIGLTHEGMWQIPQQVVLTLLFERDRRAKLWAFGRGIRDGIRTPLPPTHK
jgi:rhamnosyltransferase